MKFNDWLRAMIETHEALKSGRGLNTHSRSRAALHGALELTLIGADGRVKEARRKDNIIVDLGFRLVCDSLGNAGSRPGVLSHIGVGTGNTAPAGAQTTLVTETLRKSATYTRVTDKQFKMDATFNAGEATGALVEAGVFNASAAGTMFDRVVFSVVNKGASDTLAAAFTFTLS